MKINKKISYILSGILALSGVNIPSSISESNIKEINQMGEKDAVPSYRNVLNMPLDEVESYVNNNNPLFIVYDLTWLCLKINEKNTLFITYKYPIKYRASSGPLIQLKTGDSFEIDKNYFQDKKQTIDDMIRYLDMTHFTDKLIVDGFSILDFFDQNKLIGILNFDEFFPNRNFFNEKEDSELVFLTNDINELANFISIDLNKYNLSERIKKSIEDRSTKISLKDAYDLYMTIVPEEYLPTITQRKININPTVPIFKDEILEKKVNEKSEELGFYVLPMKSGETKFLFYYLDPKALYYYDFYTGEKISSYGNYEFNKEYLNKLGVSDDFYIEDSNGVFNYDKNMSNIRADIVEEYLPGLTYLLTISSTYGDFVEFYQKIPLNQQIDYSFYDFSKSPIIDQYEELPKPASCIPYIDYENNTLYAIPKLGKDNEIIKQLVFKNKENS